MNVEIDNIIAFLKTVSSKQKCTALMRDQIELSLGFLSTSIKNRKIASESIINILDDCIYPNQQNELLNKEETYFVDKDSYFELFNNEKISFFKLSEQNAGYKYSIIEVAQDFGLRLLSNSVKTKFEPSGKIKIIKEWSLQIHGFIDAIGYIVYNRHQDIYENIKSIFENSHKFNVYLSDDINVKYILDEIEISKTENYFISDFKIYVTDIDDSYRTKLNNKILLEILKNRNELKDIILYLTRDINALNDYLFSYDIPFPKENISNFAKTKKIKSKKQKIILFPLIDDESSSAFSEDNQDNGSKSSFFEESPDIVVNIPQKSWNPESDPKFFTEIILKNEHVNKGQNKITHAKEVKINETIQRNFHRYNFNSDLSFEEDIGVWGEEYVFYNIVHSLKEKYATQLNSIIEEQRKFIVKDKAGNEIVRFENKNEDHIVQSGYDFFLKEFEDIQLIEVKSTTLPDRTYFDLSVNQWDCCRLHPDKFVLIIVRNAGKRDATIHSYKNIFMQYNEGDIRIVPSKLSIYI